MGALVVALWLVAAPAGADKQKSKELYRKGMAAFVLERWDQAIAEFEAGFQEEPEAAFLYNIAQAHNKAGRPALAVQFYRKYLELSSDSADRAEVEREIAEQEKRLAAMHPAASSGAATERAAAATEKGADKGAAATDKGAAAGDKGAAPGEASGAATGRSVPSAALPGEAAGARPHAKRRWPIWVGVASAVVLVGAAAAIAAATWPREPQLPVWDAR
jgi:tetratricopeptide (TPR) repeat protein